MLEDELLYHKINDWEAYIEYLDKILDNEKGYGLDKGDLERWHSLLQKYFMKKPQIGTRKSFIIDIGFSDEVASEIERNIDLMRSNTKIIDAIGGLYRDFELILDNNGCANPTTKLKLKLNV